MSNQENQNADNKATEQYGLDDERRVKMLSPTALVLKQFFRNKLAIVGLFILAAMFLFSFLGPFISPYGETEVFKEYDTMQKDFASATENSDYRYTYLNDSLPAAALSKFILAISQGESVYTAGDATYTIESFEDSFYVISTMDSIGTASFRAGRFSYVADEGEEITDEVKTAFEAAFEADETTFTVGDKDYMLVKDGTTYMILTGSPAAIASYQVYDFNEQGKGASYEFRYNSELAIVKNASSFTADGITYQLEKQENNYLVTKDDQVIASISDFLVTPSSSSDYLSLEYKTTLRQAIEEGESSFTFADDNGDEVLYTIKSSSNKQYTIQSEKSTLLISIYEAPSSTHWLGTDGNGMDILTRLMYGGQISLLIGFIVVLIAVTIGIVLGGIAGYFGKWIDMVIMRMVDVFDCLPFLPLMIIIGAVMDSIKVEPRTRIFYLMLIMGLLDWSTIARLVRGQILSLREQEFMVAAEATGISTRRRIFRHLIPNVIPQLIVRATLSLGNAILMESTLSFLGLGVKHPYASWGNIVNSVNTTHVMTNYWFAWIPAGICILLTVLGFNFVGDGLRDAFDPKMKR